MEKVSVVTIPLNVASHIETAITSVRSQTDPHIKHVIIAIGSTDGTFDMA